MKFLVVDKRKRVGNLDIPHYAVRRIFEALDDRDIPHDFCHFDQISQAVENGKLMLYAKDKKLTNYTHIIMRGHRPNEFETKQSVAMFAKEHDIKVQNRDFILLMPRYNKFFQMVQMPQANLPYIDSYIRFDGQYHLEKEHVERIGFPLIYKHLWGQYRIEKIDGKRKLKKNVFLIENLEQLKEECTTRDDPEKYYIQKFVDIGEDYRTIMIGGKYLSGWKRVAGEGNFLTVTKGSEYSLYDEPSDEILDISKRTTDLYKADYIAIDIIYSEGKPYILEINMDPGFKAFETKVEGSEADVASAIVENMLSK